MRCTWCFTPQPETELLPAPNPPICRDGRACAERAGEILWAPAAHGQRPGQFDPQPGRYCCLDPGCPHPREQVFNGGAGYDEEGNPHA